MIRKLIITGEKESTVCGSKMKIERRLRYDEDGHPFIEDYDMTNLHEYIQSHEPSVNVNNIIARYTMGDDTALERAQAFYADVSQMPMSLQELFNMNQKAKEIFAQMPEDVRAIYNQNYVEFVNDPERMSKLSVEKPVEKVEKEVKPDDDKE